MPRAKIKTAEPFIVVKPFRFEPATEEVLIDLLGYDQCTPEQIARSDEAVALTAQAAAKYLGAVERAPNLPRPANQHAAIKAFSKKGDFSESAWSALHPWTRQRLTQYGAPTQEPPSNTVSIATACERYLEANPVKPTGRTRLEARARLIKALCRIFHGYGSRDGWNDGSVDEDAPGLTARRQQGAVSSYSQLEQDRYEYVCAVFAAIGIPVYKELREDIVIQANTPDEAPRRLNIIASRSRRRRKTLNPLT